MRTWLLPLVLLCVAGAPVRADDWPMSRHDAAQHRLYRAGSQGAAAAGVEGGNGKPSYQTGGLLASGGAVCAQGGEGLVLYSSSGRRLWEMSRVIPLYLKDDLLVVTAILGEGGYEIRGVSLAQPRAGLDVCPEGPDQQGGRRGRAGRASLRLPILRQTR